MRNKKLSFKLMKNKALAIFNIRNKKSWVSKNLYAISVVSAFMALTSVGFFAGYNLNNWQKKSADNEEADKKTQEQKYVTEISSKVVPQEGFTLPVSWGDLGPKLIGLK